MFTRLRGIYISEVTATDGSCECGTASVAVMVSPPLPITLAVGPNGAGTRVRLALSGASGRRVPIYAGGSQIALTLDDGRWHHRTPAPGVSPRVCENNGSRCSGDGESSFSFSDVVSLVEVTVLGSYRRMVCSHSIASQIVSTTVREFGRQKRQVEEPVGSLTRGSLALDTAVSLSTKANG